MTHSIEGLVAPEGSYVPAYSYLLPPAPSYPPPAASNTLQGNTQKEANTSNAGSGNVGTASGNATASTSTTSGVANANTGSANTGSGSSNSGVGGGNSESGIAEADRSRTALHHISMQAPSAWSHVLVIPPSRISVTSIKYPATSATRRERQQSSYMSAAEVMESSNGSDTSLGGGGAGGGDGVLSTSGISEPGAMPTIGPVLEGALASQGIDGPASHVTGGVGGLPGMSALQLLAHLGGGPAPSVTANMAAGNLLGNNSNSAAVKNLLKPKNNIKQTSSSFVQRLQNHNDYTKLFGPRTEGNTLERFAFVSRNRFLFWLGETGNGWIKDPIARLTFATTITSHDINQYTRSPTRLDVAIAFSTSDIIWFEAISSRYSRLNKAGCVNDSPITNIRWVPGSETLLLTTHSDGTCTIFDISREDSTTGSWAPIRGMTLKQGEQDGEALKDTLEDQEEEQEVLLEGKRRPTIEKRQSTTESIGTYSSTTSTRRMMQSGEHGKSAIKSWDPANRILVTRPALQETSNDGLSKKTWSKLNPVAHWRVTRSCSVTDVAFSPDHTKLAIVSTDGLLRIINLLTETLEGSFESYYGALNKVVFSPDAKFLLTAGCDDLISVWTSDGRLLSRCPGHSSFVTSLAFDPWRWKVEDKTYRFASAGEDGKVFLWDFSSAALVRPKVSHSANSQKKGIHGGSTFSLLQDQNQRRNSGPRRTSITFNRDVDSSATYLPAPPRGEVAELQPVASCQIGAISTSDSAQSGSNFSNASIASATTTTSTLPVGTAMGVGQNPNGLANGTATYVNEAGSASDLLVDVRFRPDGMLIMHKSGTLRFLQRPRQRSTSRSIGPDQTTLKSGRGKLLR